MGFLKILF